MKHVEPNVPWLIICFATLIIELTINSYKFTIFRDAQVHVLAQEGAPSRGMVGFHGEPPWFSHPWQTIDQCISDPVYTWSRKWLIMADISDISDSIYQDLMAFNGNTMVIMGLPSGYFKSLLGASLPKRDLMSDQSVQWTHPGEFESHRRIHIHIYIYDTPIYYYVIMLFFYWHESHRNSWNGTNHKTNLGLTSTKHMKKARKR